MTNGIIYYGAPVTSVQQNVAESLRLRNINLLKTTVRSVEPSAVRYIVSPSYDIYVENLHIAMDSAFKGKAIEVGIHNRYKMFESKVNLSGFEKFHVVWDYQDIQPAMDQTALDAMRGRFDPAEISIHSKPAFIAELSINQLSVLNKTQVRKTTPTVANTINIQSALALIKIQRLARAFLGTHQYSLSNDGTDPRAEMKKMFNIVKWNTSKIKFC